MSRHSSPKALLTTLVVAAALLGACSQPAGEGARRGVEARATPAQRVSPTTTTLPPAPTTTLSPPEPGWNPIGRGPGGVAVDQQTVTLPSGSQVTLTRFRKGQVHFALHVGSQDPPGAAAEVGPGAGPSISAAEAPELLAAFNGGFLLSTGAGGFEVDGNVLSPLQQGEASLVIDADGSARVGVWGQGVPAPGEAVSSVRQNLPPLVEGSQPSGDAGDVGQWGATLGGGASVARSALGQDAEGNLIYAGSLEVTPSDLASALVQAGATTAMELDVNPEWVQLAVAATPGAPLTPGVPGQHRPADQYQQGWTRDFVTVLSGG